MTKMRKSHRIRDDPLFDMSYNRKRCNLLVEPAPLDYLNIQTDYTILFRIFRRPADTDRKNGATYL